MQARVGSWLVGWLGFCWFRERVGKETTAEEKSVMGLCWGRVGWIDIPRTMAKRVL